ncbi:MAG: protein translocase subunit SecD [Candidatus Omnitrophica bacterium]|nr:protein translocase subunit SecD [Candidatus Omnitrophota bacterium]
MSKRSLYRIIIILGITVFFAYFTFPLEKRISLGLDLKGGMHLVLRVDTTHLSEEARKDAADRAVEIIRNRIDEFGVREPSIQRQGEYEVVVQLPGISERQRAIELIGKTALLEFKLVCDDGDKFKEAIKGNIPEGLELKTLEETGEKVLLYKEAVLTGEVIKNALVKFDQSSFGEPVVAIEFNSEGAKKFAQITKDNVGKRLAIVLDGKLQSAPLIKEPIPSGEAVITGRFTLQKANDLSLVLRVGALPAPMYIEEERTVGPLLGMDSIRKGLLGSCIGLGMVFIFMISYYFLSGLIAVIALLLNLLLILGGLGILPILFPGVSATLTLPGIAGIILSLGMAVDANVLINERIREELKNSSNLRIAVNKGYQRAFSAIFDSNITTLIAAFFLFQFGTGPIRGFAVTLIIGLLASLFTAIFVTRTILDLLIDLNLIKSLPMLKIIKETNIDFSGKRKLFFIISLILIVYSMGSYIIKGKTVYGIDFVGGQIQEYRFSKPVNIEDIRRVIREVGFTDVTIQQFKDDPRVVLLKMPFGQQSLFLYFKDKFPEQNIEILRIESVGPIAGKYLKKKAINSLIWSMLGILIYIAFRFKHINFAIAGIIALFHDVVIALGFNVLTLRPIDLLTITALLTIAGYSINDTIVIYDRVRENSQFFRKYTLNELINLSVNQTLSRTILTTFVTLLVVISIMIWSGEVLNNFAFTLCVGFISGVYSTIFIASPLVILFSRKR